MILLGSRQGDRQSPLLATNASFAHRAIGRAAATFGDSRVNTAEFGVAVVARAGVVVGAGICVERAAFEKACAGGVDAACVEFAQLGVAKDEPRAVCLARGDVRGCSEAAYRIGAVGRVADSELATKHGLLRRRHSMLLAIPPRSTHGKCVWRSAPPCNAGSA